MDVNSLVQTFAIYALPVLFAITLHEAAHGYVARYFGDMTAHAQGRISLNPIRHIDIVGTIVVPLAILLLSGGKFLFGWAKPVPVNYSALRKPRRHMAWVAAAGPGAGGGLVRRGGHARPPGGGEAVSEYRRSSAGLARVILVLRGRFRKGDGAPSELPSASRGRRSR